MEARGLSSEVVHHIDFAAVDSAAALVDDADMAALHHGQDYLPVPYRLLLLL